MSGFHKHLTSIVVAALVLVSVVNIAWALRSFYHAPIFDGDEWSRREQALVHARLVVEKLGLPRVAYFDEEPGWQTIEAVGEFFGVQYTFAPTILERDSLTIPYALVNFRISKRPGMPPGYVLVEDFGEGLGLYRKQ